MSKDKRRNVWLAVAGVVVKDGKWLVVKKKYGGLKGMWSLPAGFVNEGETVDEAVKREIYEETRIKAVVKDIVGIRTGVINDVISDNMIVFLLQYQGGSLQPQVCEIDKVAFLSRDELLQDNSTSKMILLFIDNMKEKTFQKLETNPGDIFQYSSYKLYY